MRRTPALFAVLCAAMLGGMWPGAPALGQGAPVGGPVTFEGARGAPLRFEGTGSYRGSLEVRRSGSDLTVVNELGLDEYLMGLAEVPGTWPMEALKAQAVAARTYALWEKERGYWQRFGFDVCATTSCQVYAGTISEQRKGGDRWVEAVRATSGEVLLDGGDPILARYHASSGGRTLPNEVVYPSSGARSYLVAVDDPFDRVSPLHRWSVEFPRQDMQEILARGINLAGTLTEIEADPDARRVTIRTEGGELTMNSVRLRRVVSRWAPELFPGRYPGPRPDGVQMPLTLPSSRFTAERTDDGFRLSGIGYGHGVGMSQWGAKGRAEDGASYTDILSAYYGGLEPSNLPEPGRLRVAVAQGVDTVTVFGEGPFEVRAGADELASSTLGAWTVTRDGRALRVQPPEGFELPLVLSGVEAPGELTYDPGEAVDGVEVRFVVPKPVQLDAVLSRAGQEVARSSGTYEAGAWTLEVPLDGDKLERRADYELALTAFDGIDRVSKRQQITIAKAGLGAGLPVVIAFLLVVGAGVLIARQARRGSSGGGPPPAVRDETPAPVSR